MVDKIEHAIVFDEELLTDGSLSVSWDANTDRDWRQLLYLVKKSIPSTERKYDKKSRKWIINSNSIHIFEHVKSVVIEQDKEEITPVNENLNDEIIAKIMGQNIAELPITMRPRAVFAINAALGIISAKVEYCISQGMFGAWNEEKNVWMYEDGRYSKVSPTERDAKAIQESMDRVRITKELYPNVLDELYNPLEYLNWKDIFRKDMLKKYDYTCYTCLACPEKTSQLHMHRVTPGKHGGQYIEDNVVIICNKCHGGHEGKPWEFIQDSHNNAKEQNNE